MLARGLRRVYNWGFKTVQIWNSELIERCERARPSMQCNNAREARLSVALQSLVNPRSLPLQPDACPSWHAMDGVEAWRQYVREALEAVDEPRIHPAESGAILRSVRSSQLQCPPSCSTKLRVALLPGTHHIANLHQIEQVVGEYVHAPLAVLSPSTSTATDRTQADRMGYARSLAAVDVLIIVARRATVHALPCDLRPAPARSANTQ